MTKRIISILLIILFVAANTGYVYSAHLCRGKVYKQALSLSYSQLNCGMEDETNTDNKNNFQLITTKCCDNVHVACKIKDDYQTTDNLLIADAPLYAFNLLVDDEVVTESKNCDKTFLNHSPPHISNLDIPVFIQSFLI